MYDLWRCRIACVHSMQTHTGPNRRQAPKMLTSENPVSAFGALRPGGGKQHGDVIAALRMTGGENFASRGFSEHPFQRLVTRAPEIRSHTHPVKVHVQAERRGRRIIG